MFKYCKTLLYFTTLISLSYYTHLYLQRLYFTRCQYDIFQVMFFKNSDFCILLGQIIRCIEGNYMEVLKVIISKFSSLV